MGEEKVEHEVRHCQPYGEKILDGVCQNPRKHAMICGNCRYNKRIETVAEEVIPEVTDIEEGQEE